MARIAWYSNSCSIKSGYGQQSAQVVHQMVANGHEVAIAANYGAAVEMTCSAGHVILPEGLLRYSIDSAPVHMKNWIGDQPGYGVVLFDLWTLVDALPFHELKLACWTPIDHDPIPPGVVKFLKDGRHHAIPMSQFGTQKLLEAGIPEEQLTYIPHGIDLTIFKDYGKEARPQMQIPDEAYLVITVAANRGKLPARKGFAEMADAMSTFMKDRLDVYWMIYTEPNGYSDGINIPRLLQAVDMDMSRVRYPHPMNIVRGISQEGMARIMSASDCHLLTSMGEGWGIPVAEAAACGTPSVVSNFSAQPELLTAHGKAVDVQRIWDEYQGSFFCIPNVQSTVRALQELYEETKAGKVNRQQVAQGIQKYDQTMLYDAYWKPLTDRMVAERKHT